MKGSRKKRCPEERKSIKKNNIASIEKTEFISGDLTWLDEEWIHLAEEAALANTATDMVRMHKRLMKLHYAQGNSNLAKRQRPRKKPVRIPSSIDESDLKEKLMRKLMEDRIFLRDDLTLASLAHELEVEPHHLSRFLNINLHTTFRKIVSSFRIHEAMTLLTKEPDVSILEIAFDSGFNSKASFNRIFKKITGSSPKQYRKKIIGSGA